jgi:hypothetical protein
LFRNPQYLPVAHRTKRKLFLFMAYPIVSSLLYLLSCSYLPCFSHFVLLLFCVHTKPLLLYGLSCLGRFFPNPCLPQLALHLLTSTCPCLPHHPGLCSSEHFPSGMFSSDNSLTCLLSISPHDTVSPKRERTILSYAPQDSQHLEQGLALMPYEYLLSESILLNEQ